MKTNLVVDINTKEKEYKQYMNMDLEDIRFIIFKDSIADIYVLGTAFGNTNKHSNFYMKHKDKNDLSNIVNELRPFIIEIFETDNPIISLMVTVTDDAATFERIYENDNSNDYDNFTIETIEVSNISHNATIKHLPDRCVDFVTAKSLDGFLY